MRLSRSLRKYDTTETHIFLHYITFFFMPNVNTDFESRVSYFSCRIEAGLSRFKYAPYQTSSKLPERCSYEKVTNRLLSMYNISMDC